MPRARAARKAEAARGTFPCAVHFCAPPIGGRLVILCGAGRPAQTDRRIYPGAASTALPAKVIDGRSAERAEQGAPPGKELSAPPRWRAEIRRSAVHENGDFRGHNPRKRGRTARCGARSARAKSPKGEILPGEKCKKSPAKRIDLSAGDMV